MSSWRQIASSNPVITIQKETEPWGHVGLGQCHTGQGRPGLFFCSLYLHSLNFFLIHLFTYSFIWDLPKYLLNGREALGIQS